MFSISQAKKTALSKLSGHWSTPVLLTLVISLIMLALSVPGFIMSFNYLFTHLPEQFSNGTSEFNSPLIMDMYRQIFSAQILTYILQLIIFIITGAISIALSRFYLALISNPGKTNFNTFFEGLTYWGKGILAMLWMSLWIWLWCLLFFAIFFVLIIIAVIISAAGTGFSNIFMNEISPETGGAAIAIGIIMVIWCAAFYIVIINRTLAYSLTLFVQAEYPSVSVSKTLKASIAMTKGCRGKLFLFGLSFIGWGLLAVLTAGIGMLWLTPYMSASNAVVYRTLKEKAFEKGLFVTAQKNANESSGMVESNGGAAIDSHTEEKA